MTHLIRAGAVAVTLLGFTGIADAHTGVHTLAADGFASGFVHPFGGLDHVLAMVAVGLWAASLGGVARWAVPAAFVAIMTLGAAGATHGLALPAVEPMIALSVIALGVLIALSVRIPALAAAATVALFGLFHGCAHGIEMPAMAQPLSYGAGFAAATVALHGIGLALGALLPRFAPGTAVRYAGGAIALAGAALALPV
jgi:urease accessory protein